MASAGKAAAPPGVSILPGGKIKKVEEPVVTVCKAVRNKRKCVTTVAGLDRFGGIKLKDAAKIFGRTFSCGASVVKSAAGEADEIDIQGDFKEDVVDLILQRFPAIPASSIFFLDGKTKVRAR
eukprot:gnl/Spiro4/25897_TR12899_c0_g1_i1.p6 gnl/Spiro4/25897_TR12899_c0_g1~~gnl/Spiro4/25897_TR12899_c0_g1_i1.p6  ORF type:complete len:123 (+),score=34.95 gnl/Spiro4/25897_TR12899_c0_g1_i1:601-969(+)